MSLLRETPFSVLDLAAIRRGGDAGEALAHCLALARCAEAAGYARFWVAEHHNMDGIASSAPEVLIAHLAARTERIRVGAGGVMLPNHAPLAVAERFGTLAALHPGRIDLGLGRAPGTDPWTASALRRGRGAEEFPAQVAEIRRLLGPVQPGQRLVAVPGADSDVQLWLLGSSLFSARLAAELGLPYAFASHFAPQQLEDALELYRAEFRSTGPLAAPYVAIAVPLVAALDDAEAELLASSLRQRWLALLRGASLQLPPPSPAPLDASPGERAAIGELLGVAAIGGRERACRHLSALLARTGADELLFTCDIYDQPLRRRALQLLAEWRAAG